MLEPSWNHFGSSLEPLWDKFASRFRKPESYQNLFRVLCKRLPRELQKYPTNLLFGVSRVALLIFAGVALALIADLHACYAELDASKAAHLSPAWVILGGGRQQASSRQAAGKQQAGSRHSK